MTSVEIGIPHTLRWSSGEDGSLSRSRPRVRIPYEVPASGTGMAQSSCKTLGWVRIPVEAPAVVGQRSDRLVANEDVGSSNLPYCTSRR